MVWNIIDQLMPIKDVNVRAFTFKAKLDDAARAELQGILQRCYDRRIIIALKLAFGKVTGDVLSDVAVWLVLHGRQVYERVLEDPDLLAEFEEIGKIDSVGRFKFKGQPAGPKWSKQEIKDNLPRVFRRYGQKLPPKDAPSQGLSKVGEITNPVLLFIKKLFQNPETVDFAGALSVSPREVHGIRMLDLEPGKRFSREPVDAAARVLWQAMNDVSPGETIMVDGVGTLACTERREFTAYDPQLGRDRTIPAKTVYTLRVLESID